MNLPQSAIITTKMNCDGDTMIDSVSYPTQNGKTQTVKFKTTIDGDHIPETGYTMDGDFNYPNQKYNLDF